jgi:hypothetical protein
LRQLPGSTIDGARLFAYAARLASAKGLQLLTHTTLCGCAAACTTERLRHPHLAMSLQVREQSGFTGPVAAYKQAGTQPRAVLSADSRLVIARRSWCVAASASSVLRRVVTEKRNPAFWAMVTSDPNAGGDLLQGW